MVAQEDPKLTFYNGHTKSTAIHGKIIAEKELKISWSGPKQKGWKGHMEMGRIGKMCSC